MKNWLKRHKMLSAANLIVIVVIVAGVVALAVNRSVSRPDPQACRDALYAEMVDGSQNPDSFTATKPAQCNGFTVNELSELFSQASAKYMSSTLGK